MTVLRWGKVFLPTQTIRSLRLSKGLVCKAVPVFRWGEVFLLTQTIRSLRLSKGLVCNEVPVLVGVKFFANTRNPLPELVEGSLFAKKCLFLVGVKFFLLPQTIRSLRALEGSLCAKETTALRQAQGPCFDRCSGLCHPERTCEQVISGSV